MKLIEALLKVKYKGIKKLYGPCEVEDIDTIINHAKKIAEGYIKYADTWGKEKDNYKIEVIQGVTFIMSGFDNDYCKDNKCYIPFYSSIPEKEATEIWEQSLNEAVIKEFLKKWNELEF